MPEGAPLSLSPQALTRLNLRHHLLHQLGVVVNTRRHLGKRIGFDDVVVGTVGKAFYQVFFLRFGAHQKNRELGGIVVFAQGIVYVVSGRKVYGQIRRTNAVADDVISLQMEFD